MSAQRMAYISIDSVINDYLEEAEMSVHRYAKAWQLCFRGMEDMGIDFFYTIRSVKLPVLANKTVLLPPDFLQYTKIGVLNDVGEIIQLKYNNNLTLIGDLLPNRQTLSVDPNITPGWYNCNSPVFYNYWTNDCYTTLYGMPSGGVYVGSFNIDLPNGVILLNEHYSNDYLMLEYVASPNPTIDYNVPMQFREALISWLWWKDKKAVNVKRGQVGISRDLKSEYYNQRRLANARWRPLILDQAYQLNLDMQRLTVKA